MNRRDRSLDSDGLQADVMRFMAIIAFCLIAILALVDDLPAADPEPVMADVPASTDMMQQQPAVEQSTPQAAAQPVPERRRETAVTASEPVQSPPVLQFASDESFLKAIAGRQVALFVHQDRSIRKLTDDFRLVPASPQQAVYRIQPDTVPLRIRQLTGDSDAGFVLALPAQALQRISALTRTHQHSGGAIVINEQLEITYEP